MRADRPFVRRLKKDGVSYLMMAPYLSLFIVFTVIPVCYAIALSFTSFNLFQAPRFLLLKTTERCFCTTKCF